MTRSRLLPILLAVAFWIILNPLQAAAEDGEAVTMPNAYGDLADHYNLLCEGKATSYAKKLLTWQIVASALAYPTTVLLGAADLSKGIEAVPMDFWVFLLACLAAGVVSSVFYFISLHKIYRLFAPHCAVGLTVLTILVPVSIPVIFLAIARREPCFPFTVETEPPPVPPADMDTGYYSI